MNDESATMSDCPSKQAISELVDGSERAEVVAHLEHCGDCRGVKNAYLRITDAARTVVTPGPDLSERIKAACARLPESGSAAPKILWFQRPLVRIAAAVAVSASLVTLLGIAVGRLGGERPVAATENQQETGTVVATTGEDVLGVPAVSGEVEPADVQKVTVPGIPAQDSVPQTSNKVVVQLPGRVRHVWAVGDVDASEQYLKSILEDAQYSMSHIETGRTAFEIQLRDAELQKLVNSLAERKWSLVSSGLPQPREANEVNFLGRKVTYNLELVQGRNSD
jgi:hypothetical protein